MNNKHQELIDQMKDFAVNYTEHDGAGVPEKYLTFHEIDFDNQLQDTIDTVLAVQREEQKQNLYNHIKHSFNGYAGVRGFTEFELYDLVEKALDKTPPNKV